MPQHFYWIYFLEEKAYKTCGCVIYLSLFSWRLAEEEEEEEEEETYSKNNWNIKKAITKHQKTSEPNKNIKNQQNVSTWFTVRHHDAVVL